MKKLIVFSVIFALVAGSVFAADIGVTVLGAAELLNGNDVKEVKETKDNGSQVWGNANKNSDSFGIGRINVEGSGALEDGTIGGWARLRAGGGQGSPVEGWGKVWWKPIDAFQLQLGANPDGEWGLDGVAGWSFYQLACDVSIINNGNTWGGSYTGLDVKFRDAFFGGWGNPNALIFNITPVEALAIHLAFPLTSEKFAYKDYLKFTLQGQFNIDGVGTAAITYQNGLGHEDGEYKKGTIPGTPGTIFNPNGGTDIFDKDGNKIGNTGAWSGAPVPGQAYKVYGGDTNDPSKLFIYFGLTAIENLGVDIGVGLTLPSDVVHTEIWDAATDKKTSEITVTHNYPIAAGIGVNFSSDALGVKARVLGIFGGNTETKTTTGIGTPAEDTKTVTVGEGLTMLIDVQPSFAVNETMTAYLSLGTGFKTGWDAIDRDDGKVYKVTRSEFAWHVQPYVVITPSYWSGAFFAGFRLESPITRDDVPEYAKGTPKYEETLIRRLNWSIPIGISFSF